MKTTSAEHVLPMFCACSFYGNSMNDLLSYCGLADAGISASEKDLPVIKCVYWKSKLHLRKMGSLMFFIPDRSSVLSSNFLLIALTAKRIFCK